MTSLSERVESAVNKIEGSSDIAKKFADINEIEEFNTPNGSVKPIGLLQKNAEQSLLEFEQSATETITRLRRFQVATFIPGDIYYERNVYFLNDGIVYTPINLPYTAGVSISADIDAGKFSILQGLTEFDLATTEQAMAGIAGLIPDSAGVLATINQFDFLSSASIETNLNGNGRYWKFPNGLLICIRNMGANYVPGSWKYWPLPFIDDKYAVAGISTVSGGNDPDIENLLSVKLTLKGPSAYKPWLHMVVGVNGEVKPVRFEYDIIAIGRWKE